MLKARIKIGNAQPVDITDTYGFVYLDSDKRVGAPTKGFEATSYPEEPGEHIIPVTVDGSFDYKVKFFVRAKRTESGGQVSIDTINERIAYFNNQLFEWADTDHTVKQFKKVVFYNDHKRHKIVGYPQPIAEAETFWRDTNNQVNDVAVIEMTIRVDEPQSCTFDGTDNI